MSTKQTAARMLVCGTIALAGLIGPGGCVGYNVYPTGAGERGFTNVNSDPVPTLVTEALKWSVTRYPPDASTEFAAAAPAGPGQTPFAVNLPAGMNAMVAERVVKNIGYNAQPMAPGNESLPVYHVARVWVSGDDAKVDIVRPVLGALGPVSASLGVASGTAGAGAGAGGTQVTQGITVRLRGGMKPWTVTSHRVWSFNAMAVPAVNYVPGSMDSARAE